MGGSIFRKGRTGWGATVRVCSEPGCPDLVATGSKCEGHRKAAKRASAAKRRKTPEQEMYAGHGSRGRAWRRARAQFKRTHPICEDETGCIMPTEHVHHLDGDPLGPRGLDPTNFQALCLPHHSKKTARETPAGWNAR